MNTGVKYQMNDKTILVTGLALVIAPYDGHAVPLLNECMVNMYIAESVG